MGSVMSGKLGHGNSKFRQSTEKRREKELEHEGLELDGFLKEGSSLIMGK